MIRFKKIRGGAGMPRGTLVFVHGTGVRKEGWVEIFGRVTGRKRPGRLASFPSEVFS
jgi:hypothetical protein